MSRQRISRHALSRRDVLKRAAIGAATISLAAPAIAQKAAARVVVGGGLPARAYRSSSASPRIMVALANQPRIHCLVRFSNNVIAGLRDLKAQQFDQSSVPRSHHICASGHVMPCA
jgi:hypothetical protein